MRHSTFPGPGMATVLRQVFSEVRQSHRHAIPVRINGHVARTQSRMVGKINFTLHGMWPRPHVQMTRELMDHIGKELATWNPVLWSALKTQIRR